PASEVLVHQAVEVAEGVEAHQGHVVLHRSGVRGHRCPPGGFHDADSPAASDRPGEVNIRARLRPVGWVDAGGAEVRPRSLEQACSPGGLTKDSEALEYVPSSGREMQVELAVDRVQ